jgi:hypothetical protein
VRGWTYLVAVLLGPKWNPIKSDHPETVMPGLVPGIHEKKHVDGRDKPGHDAQRRSNQIG